MSFDNHVIAESCNISFSYDNCTASYVLSTTIQPLSRLWWSPCVADRDIIFSPGWTIVTVYCMVHQLEIWTDGKTMRINWHVLFYSCSTTTELAAVHTTNCFQNSVHNITYRARQFDQPAYLCSELEDYPLTRNSRSASAPLLNRPHVNNVLSSRAFAVWAPTVWNSMQPGTRLSFSMSNSI